MYIYAKNKDLIVFSYIVFVVFCWCLAVICGGEQKKQKTIFSRCYTVKLEIVVFYELHNVGYVLDEKVGLIVC